MEIDERSETVYAIGQSIEIISNTMSVKTLNAEPQWVPAEVQKIEENDSVVVFVPSFTNIQIVRRTAGTHRPKEA